MQLAIAFFTLTLAYTVGVASGRNAPRGSAGGDGGLQIELDQILNNNRLLDAYTKCYLGTGPCPGPAKKAKGYLAEVFATNCGKCNEEQKRQTKIAFRKLREKRPGDFRKVFAKYNPGNTHFDSFNRWLNYDKL
uniref:Chemosensory protein n=1 Tax=Corythucha ciliata TaxID=369451 RepID=A0A2S0M1C0_CORCT|nr:chemosensory protein 8 [Corythucha ciliata]AVM86431.1 chemosensory protein [Corythucha ciliata]